MTTLFFVRAGSTDDERPPWPTGASLHIWRPQSELLPPAGSRWMQNAVWAAFSGLGVFSNPDFAEITIWKDRLLLHRLVLTPRWARFPFMAPEDLQIGAVWTHPAWRRQGLARAAVAQAHRLCAGRGGLIWYVTEASNLASVRLIEANGYRLRGEGRRTRPLGLPLLGRFVLEQSAA